MSFRMKTTHPFKPPPKEENKEEEEESPYSYLSYGSEKKVTPSKKKKTKSSGMSIKLTPEAHADWY